MLRRRPLNPPLPHRMRDALSIAHVDSEETFRGGQQALLQLALGLRERGHRQVLVTPPGSALEAKAKDAGLSTAPLASLRSALKENAVRVVHSHSGHAHNRAWLASTGLDVRRVTTRHVAFEPRHSLIHRLKYTLTCDRIIAVSAAARDMLVRSGIPVDKIEVIHTGVRIPAALPTLEERQKARRHWGLSASDFAVGHLGAFTHEKGQDVAVATVKLLDLPSLRLILAGEGPLKSSFTPDARIQLPGYVEDRATLFQALDLFVMPSRAEAWGLAALEAMSYGVPVVASAVGGLPEIVEDNVSGWLVPADNPVALARAITQARPLAESFGPPARERAKMFSLEETIRRTEALYYDL
jgi:glycosyltransferase involved in cell wall biosynthesis